MRGNIIMFTIGCLAFDQFPPTFMYMFYYVDSFGRSRRHLGLEFIHRFAIGGFIILQPVDNECGGAGGESVQIGQ